MIINLKDTLIASNNYKLIMSEVKKDTIDFGQGKLIATDIYIVKRTYITNDNKSYRLILNHFLDFDLYTASLSK